jgi:pimeloyl-ACP methyl ester carboxylesterase
MNAPDANARDEQETAGFGQPWLRDDVEDRSRLITLPFGRVFVIDVGPGTAAVAAPPLCLLHGLFLTHYAFRRIIPELAVHRRVVALDLPGAGDSDRPSTRSTGDYAVDWLAHAVLQTLAAIGIERFDLLGHDFGGAVAVAIAAEEPRRVRRLALLDPVVIAVSLPLQGTLSVVPSLGPEVFKRTLRRADLRRFLVQGTSTPELVSDSDVNVYWDRLTRRGGREATYAMLSQLGTLISLRDRLRAVEAPTLVMWGDRDQLVAPEQGDRLVELMPEARLELVDGCGHNPADERPTEVARLIEDHLR